MDIAIFGCCCSGDILRLAPGEFNLGLYAASTSITSQMAAPVPVDAAAIIGKNRFERQNVLRDFGKTFLTELAAKPVDYLILDFVSDVSHHARVRGSLVKWSTALRNSNLAAVTGYKFQLLPDRAPAAKVRWQEACREFVARLSAILPSERIILHRAFWREQYRDGTEILPFPPELRREAVARNTWLWDYYAFFADLMPGCQSLDLSTAVWVASAQHTWGLTPHHFEDGYYQQAAAELHRIMDRGG